MAGLRALSVDHERLQAAAKNLAELALQGLNGVGDDHGFYCTVTHGPRTTDPGRTKNKAPRTTDYNAAMRLRQLNLGCVGGGTGLPSLLGGLKQNPWLHLNAVVTMFDSGGSSGQLRDELGVLPPGDVLKCALALARNEGEARRVLLARLPTLEHHARLGGHTGGNLLLS